MASLDRAFIDDLLSRIDIVEVIGNSVKLKKHGSGLDGAGALEWKTFEVVNM